MAMVTGILMLMFGRRMCRERCQFLPLWEPLSLQDMLSRTGKDKGGSNDASHSAVSSAFCNSTFLFYGRI